MLAPQKSNDQLFGQSWQKNIETNKHLPKNLRPHALIGMNKAHVYYLLSDNTSYACEISLNLLSASSLVFGFLSGCHFSANFLYLFGE